MTDTTNPCAVLELLSEATRARAAALGQTPEPPVVLVVDEAPAVFAAAQDSTTRALTDLARTVAPRSLQRHPYGG
ncbi:hypothetical protein ACFC5T_40275 [Streptomyces sp. NPDC055961]|uniref:hypothetical protein n=1 Tax=Streptomyces sp. NPDC055961 TaxID=3345666 RepID=UPI0035DB1B7D